MKTWREHVLEALEALDKAGEALVARSTAGYGGPERATEGHLERLAACEEALRDLLLGVEAGVEPCMEGGATVTKRRAAVTTWPAKRCWDVWVCSERQPWRVWPDGHTEWRLPDGSVSNARPKRAAKCAACGGTLAAGEATLYALDCAGETRFHSVGRYLHPAPCIDRQTGKPTRPAKGGAP